MTKNSNQEKRLEKQSRQKKSGMFDGVCNPCYYQTIVDGSTRTKEDCGHDPGDQTQDRTDICHI